MAGRTLLERTGLGRSTDSAHLLRKVVVASAVVASSAAATVAGVALLFRAEGEMARKASGDVLGTAGPWADRVYHPSYGQPIRLLLAGDSLAASLGAANAKTTFGARVARGLAKHSFHAVDLRTVAVVGSLSSELEGQLDGLPDGYVPDIAVLVVGGNDVMQRVPPAESVAALKRAVERLRAQGAEVVVGTCPDLGMLPAVPQPLRSMGGRASRHLAAAQYKAVLAAGGRPVELGQAVKPLFLADPADMFAADHVHPSSLGYRRAARVMLPAILAAHDQAGGVAGPFSLPAGQ